MTVIDDAELRQAVLDEFACEPLIAKEAIGVSVNRGVVTLTGKVDTYAKKALADKAAQRVAGVEAVAEEIAVDVPNSYHRTDEQIAEAALNALKWHATVPESHVKVKVENGWITLAGNVEWGYQKTAVEDAVKNLSGVRGVSNMVITKPGLDSESVKDQINRHLRNRIERDLKHIQVKTREGTVELHGNVSSWMEKQEAAKAAWSTPGVSNVENHLVISV